MVVLAACGDALAPEAEVGYAFALPERGGVVYRWPVGATVGVYLAGGEGEREALLATAFEEAAADWEAALEGAVRIRAVERPEEAHVVLRWSDVVPPVETEECEPKVHGRAATTFCWTPGRTSLRPFPPRGVGADGGGGAAGGMSGEAGSEARAGADGEAGADEGTVRMLVTVLAEEATGLARVRQLVAHELGHVLGIGHHSMDPADLMWEGGLRAVQPTVADRATVRRLYETAPDILIQTSVAP